MYKILVSLIIFNTYSSIDKIENNLIPNLTLPQKIQYYTRDESWKSLLWSTVLSGITTATFLGIKKQWPQFKPVKTLLDAKTNFIKTSLTLFYIIPQVYNYYIYSKFSTTQNITEFIKNNEDDNNLLKKLILKKYFFQPNLLRILGLRLNEESLTNNTILNEITGILSKENLNDLIIFIEKDKKNSKNIKEDINLKIKYSTASPDEWIHFFHIQKDKKKIENYIKDIITKNTIPFEDIAKKLADSNDEQILDFSLFIYDFLQEVNEGLAINFSDTLLDIVINKINNNYYNEKDIKHAIFVYTYFDKENIDKYTKLLIEKLKNYKYHHEKTILLLAQNLTKDKEEKNFLMMFWFNLHVYCNIGFNDVEKLHLEKNCFNFLVRYIVKNKDSKFIKDFLNKYKNNIKKKISFILETYINTTLATFSIDFYKLIDLD